MNITTKKNFGVCQFCGADKVRNPKTGKIFCSEKCWLKDKPTMKVVPIQEDRPDWNEIRRQKAEGQAKGAAFNKSVDVVIAAYNRGEINFDDIPSFVEKVHKRFMEINLNGEI